MSHPAPKTEPQRFWWGKIPAHRDLFLDIGGTRESSSSNFRALGPTRKFTPEENAHVHTSISFNIPFGMYGLSTTVPVEDALIHLSLEHHPLNISAYNIGFSEFNSNELDRLHLVPDNKGFTCYTKATIEFTKYIDVYSLIVRNQRDHQAGKSDAHQKLTLAINRIVNQACERLNIVIDHYCMLEKNYNLYHISVSDISRVELWQTLDGPRDSGVPWNAVITFLPSEAALTCQPTYAIRDSQLVDRIRSMNAIDKTYNVAYRSYLEARRAYNSNESALATIHATTAVEIAVTHFIGVIQQRSKEDPVLSRVSKGAFEEAGKDVTFQISLRLLLPLMVPSRFEFPKEDADACNSLRKMRNTAIHSLTEYQRLHGNRDIGPDLCKVKNFLDFIVMVDNETANAMGRAEESNK